MADLYAAPTLSTIKISRFLGIDTSMPEDQIKPYRAATALNMIPDAAGEVRKRPGIQAEKQLSGIPGNKPVVAMLNGLHPVTWNEIQTPCYALYIKRANSFVMIAETDHMPLAASYGDKDFIFLYCEDNAQFAIGTIGGTATEENAFTGALCVVEGSSIFVYTDEGYKYALTDAGTWNREKIKPTEENLITPVILNGCDPAGGGSPFKAVNLLNPWVTESFSCKNEINGVFYLQSKVSETNDPTVRWSGAQMAAHFKVEILCAIEETEGDASTITMRWIERPIGTEDGFRPSANRIYLDKSHNTNISYTKDDGTTATISVGTGTDGWIGPSPLNGEDNVRITHLRSEFQAGFIAICQSAAAAVFGVGGYKDRLFLGQYNRVYYSELENPLYIGDLNYVELEAGTEVMAMDGTAENLAIITAQGIYFLSGGAASADDTEFIADAVFKISAKIPAPAPLGYGNTAILGGEIVYLSKEGVVAVAAKDHYSERYAEYRSALIDRAMLADQPQRILNAGRYLLIFCAGGVCWLLDENQPNSEGDKPYSAHQYEGYRMNGFTNDVAFMEAGTLKLISGRTQYQWMDGTAANHYHDGEETAIHAYWETPWIYGSTFYRKKIFMKLGLLLGQLEGADTCVKVEGRKNAEEWKLIWGYDGMLCSFGYDKLDYRLFTYAPQPGCPDIGRKIKIKKALCFKLRFTNDFFNQPFILREYGLDYVSEN
ncbi:MAG: hypothetical protein DBX52_02905 [Clostridiales bacterium]|nr:MAG: hypothetical protein DBX52_02905 [Clostridiales bacterium]